MSRPRRLPISTPPLPGEALDSWLETLAARTHTHYSDLLTAVGLLTSNDPGRAETRWTIQLTVDEITSLTSATRTSPEELADMTLSRYDGIALRMAAPARVERANLWGRPAGSRYCPDCLYETDRRWLLRWRLGWSFACTGHKRLLADACPTCQRITRDRPHPISHIPNPGHCARAGTAGGTTCGTDLSATATAALDASDPALHAQLVVDAAIDTGQAAFGIYRDDPQPAASVLNDIRCLAHQLQRLDHIPEGLHDLRQSAGHDPTQPARPALWRPATAAAGAYAVTAALTILDTDTDHAIAAISEVIGIARERGTVTTMTTVGAWSKHTSPVLSRLQAAALAPTLRRVDLIRHIPPEISRPSTTTIRSRGRHLPTLFWPEWYLRLTAPAARSRHVPHRAVMSCAVLLTGTHANKIEAITTLSAPISTQALSWGLGVLHGTGRWAAIHTAFTRAANAVDDGHCPIDYDRRRALDYSDLLTTNEWRAIHDGLDRPTPFALRTVAAAHLYEKLSTRPANTYLYCEASALLTRIVKLIPRLDIDLAARIDEAGVSFLERRGITDEPLTWSPPVDLLDDLDLAGCWQELDIERLHRLLSVESLSLHQAAEQMRTNAAVVAHTLAVNPPPSAATVTGPASRPIGSTPPKDGATRRRLLRQLPAETFRHLYETEQLGLRTIASRYGCGRTTLRRLAREYGITMRPPERPPTYRPPERDWLYREYVTNKRTLPDLAQELGVSVMKINVWAHQYDIPLRPRGGASHAARANSR